ncbi:hypothetical protein [Leptothoe spongobia]|uniref:Uncharacterized protein n=1 Tax=Leptothoe spongobia TAU-MAC 1115 TaxID=1967444 RepID=A0A947GFQ7_9CYAN|nr:hypothetical protein [Leptothoe spongobia]MBT9313884.1 hypothetical protein [Leptothoe spongobia TAU-MAC 1115]
MTRKEHGICKLCLKESKLCYSHILSEFLYKEMYEDQRFALKQSGHKQKKQQKGIREYLLCGECEKKLSKYESHASRILKNKCDWPSPEHSGYFTLKAFNYQFLKGFFLSILWRSSVSKNQLFDQVNLGGNEEDIRLRLLGEDFGGPRNYPVCMFTLEDNPLSFYDEKYTLGNFHFIQPPVRKRVEKNWAYIYVYMGFKVLQFSSFRVSLSEKFDNIYLQPDCWRIGLLTKENNPQTYIDFAENVKRIFS